MEGSEIKKLMSMAGVTQVEIAKKVGVSKGCVNHVIAGIRSNNRVRQAIAEAVGKTVEELWGNDCNNGKESEESKYFEEEPFLEAGSEKCDASEKRNDEFKIVVSPYCYYRANNSFINKSLGSLYYRLSSGKDDGVVYSDFKNKKNRYYIAVNDPLEVQRISFDKKVRSILKEQNDKWIKKISVKIDRKISWLARKILIPNTDHYERFFKFLKEGKEKPGVTLEVGGPIWVTTNRIKLKHEDYLFILDLAKKNRIQIGKVLEIGLKSFWFYIFTTLQPELGEVAEENKI